MSDGIVYDAPALHYAAWRRFLEAHKNPSNGFPPFSVELPLSQLPEFLAMPVKVLSADEHRSAKRYITLKVIDPLGVRWVYFKGA